MLYLNGIAIGVIELKRSSVEIADGVRQLITNQEEIFNKRFFTTVQLVFAGNDSQGLRYGTVTTREEFFVEWKAAPLPDGAPVPPGALLDRPLAEMCEKSRLLDLIRNFIIFDNGIKKVPRPHQFAGVKAAQERIRQREGGVIWHTQGSGKSILMVLLAKWLLEHDPEARILDRHRPRRAGQADRGRDEERRGHRRELAFAPHHRHGRSLSPSSAPPRRGCCAR